MSIIQLSPDVISKIRAGEVIQRPVNVVKELIENSLDAGASDITIRVKKGGKQEISVIDNGSGMSIEDAKLCAHPHTTSKISAVTDLESLVTLGFRGEALHSIAQVSMLSIQTKTKGTDIGSLVSSFGGEISHRLTGCRDGTAVHVRSLFYNVPVRLSASKSDSAETALITKVVGRLMLLNPKVSFSYYVNDSLHLIQKSDGAQSESIRQVIGPTIMSGLREISFESKGISIEGYISAPHVVRKTCDYIVLSINGRYIQDTQPFIKMIRGAYRRSIQDHDYPIIIMRIKMDAGKIDPNVHPQKSTVGILDEESLKAAIYQVIVENHDYLRKSSISYGENVQQPTLPGMGSDPDSFRAEEPPPSYGSHEESLGLLSSLPSSPELAPPRLDVYQFPELDLVGQYDNSYILAGNTEFLFVIDQHALHEKILFEDLCAQQKIEFQEPIQAYVLHVTPEDSDLLESSCDIFKEFGFEIEKFSDNKWKCYRVPVLMGLPVSETHFLDIVRDTVGNLGDKPDLDGFRKSLFAEVACKSAKTVKETLSMSEMTGMLSKARTLGDAYYCPHGRPVAKVFRRSTVDKWVKR